MKFSVRERERERERERKREREREKKRVIRDLKKEESIIYKDI